jgi:ABC-type transporter MlaC component
MLIKIKIAMIAIIVAFWFVVVASSFSIYAVYAQTNSNNMSSSMIESARMHIRAADKALASGNATGALDQVNFAQMQLSMMGMKNMGTMNEQQVKEFMKGGASTPNMNAVPENCIVLNGGVLRCRDSLTQSYSFLTP